MLILLVMSLMAIGAGLISPQDPTRVNVANQFQPPSAEHLLGTDRLGRDLWTRLLYAGRISLAVGLSAALVATSIGVVIGLVAGLAGGRVDAVLMRLTDVVLALPSLIIIAVVSSIFGRGMEVIVLFIGLVGWTDCARVVRGLTLSLRELDFVHAAQTMGASSWWIMRRHLLWHIVPVLTVTASFAVAFAILTEAALSFLGIGAPAPLFSWGSMLTDASDITILTQRPWYWLPPGLAVIVTVLAVTMVGEGIRDALNPQERRA